MEIAITAPAMPLQIKIMPINTTMMERGGFNEPPTGGEGTRDTEGGQGRSEKRFIDEVPQEWSVIVTH